MAIRRSDFLLIPNIISMIRCLCAIPAFLLFRQNPTDFLPILILCTVIIVTDFLDGALARKLNQQSDLGLLLDPLGDKLIMAAAFLAMILAGHISAALFAIIVGKDLIIAAAGAVVVRKSGSTPASNTHGKWASAALAFGIAFRIVFATSTLTPSMPHTLVAAFTLLALAGISMGVTFALLSLVSYGTTAYSLLYGRQCQNKTKSLLYLIPLAGSLLFFLSVILPRIKTAVG